MIKKTSLYLIFLGFLIKKGNIKSAKKILNKALQLVLLKIKISKELLLLKLFKELNCFVELKKIRIKRRFVLVPFAANFKRRTYLVTKWLIEAILKKKNLQKSLAEKLAIELQLLYQTPLLAYSYKLKMLNIKKALSNRSNIHYRW
jgi:ribosomal protein S7